VKFVGRQAFSAGLALACAVALTACVSRDGGATPSSTSAPSAAKSSKPATTSGKPGKSTTVSLPPTTSTLGAFPPVLSSAPSGVDTAAIRSVADLPRAFQCTAAVTPIEIPAGPSGPAAVVCPSKLAGGEALYLWYTGTPDERYLALTEAIRKTKYVRAGTTWVAGGFLTPTLGQVGGDAYK